MSVPVRPRVIELMAAGLRALRNHEETINALNVFPVPDGDTGTNLVMTVQTICERLAQAPHDSFPEQMKAITIGSLMGARGNSGVILSQIARGICERLGDGSDLGARAVAEALQNGVKVAYQAIRKPVEGTMLTVIRDAAAAASSAVNTGEADVCSLLDTVVREAGSSVARTPDLLPVLKEAGVVDAGGYGLVALGDGIVGALLGRGETTEALIGEAGSATISEEVDLEYRYCTEFVVHAAEFDAQTAEEFLQSVGGSVMVAASPGVCRIHVHTNTPGQVIDWAAARGGLDQVKLNDMAAQVRERAAAYHEAEASGGIGIVAVANGVGVVEILKSLGVHGIVDGGQTMNPSASELAHAVDEVPYAEVVILPNNSNIVLTAEQVAQITSKKVHVVATKTIPQAFAALLAFDEAENAQTNEGLMTDAAARVRTCELTYAVRGGTSGDVRFRKGDLIGLVDGSIVVSGREVERTAVRLLDSAVDPEAVSMTVLIGDGTDRDMGEKIATRLAKKHPRLDIDLQDGGQPLYPIVAGIE